jgi:D-alanyl-D-alanine carboxypeptidase
MIKKELSTTVFYIFCSLVVLGMVKSVSTTDFSILKPKNQVLAAEQSFENPTLLDTPIPITDEEDLSDPDPFIVEEPHENPTPEEVPPKKPVPAIQETPETPEEKPVEQAPKEPVEKPVKKKSSKCPSGKLTSEYHDLVPVSPDFGLDGYQPDDLVVVPSEIPTPRTICVRAETLTALEDMYAAMKLAEIKTPMIISGFRSKSHQGSIQKNNRTQVLPDGTEVRSVALPEHSEHQLGTTVDFAAAPSYNIKDFEKSSAYAWMIEHADEYGFVQSYHYGDEHDTGYRGEPWHWRYVGPTHAQSVVSTGKILFEYLEDFVKNTK